MALQIAFTDDDGVTLATSYHKITAWHTWNGEAGLAGQLEVTVWRDDAARQSGTLRPKRTLIYGLDAPACRQIFALQANPTPVVPLNRAYLYLKTLPDYAAAVDV